MPTRHVDKLIEAYLDNLLTPQKRRQVEAHIRECPACAHHLFEAKRVAQQLGPVMQAALGQPTPHPSLHCDVKNALTAKQAKRSSGWVFPARFLNAVGTVAVIAVLAVGVFVTVRGQLPRASEPTSNITLKANNGGGDVSTSTPAPTATSLALLKITPTPHRLIASQGDTLPKPTPTPTLKLQKLNADALSSSSDSTETTKDIEAALSKQEEAGAETVSPQIAVPPLPGGTIAYALFNATPGREVYEIHFMNPDGSEHQLFPLDGVSEPALHPTSKDRQLAFRAWGGPTSPRSLQTGNRPDQRFESVTHFWEDAQPDWSPVEDRLIFASQRESDRRWRLYTVWGDGSIEVNLRREGRSPTFAPDGYRFAFESCHSTGEQCGLWIADLDHSEYGSKPFLLDPLAKSPDWSPVGEEIVFMANPNDNWDLYLVNSNGSNVRRLTNDPAIDGLPVWSPDGQWVAFVSNRGGEWGIWLLHVNSSKLHHAITFDYGTFAPPENLMPYNENDPRRWWDEQLSWGN